MKIRTKRTVSGNNSTGNRRPAAPKAATQKQLFKAFSQGKKECFQTPQEAAKFLKITTPGQLMMHTLWCNLRELCRYLSRNPDFHKGLGFQDEIFNKAIKWENELQNSNKMHVMIS